MSNFLHPGRLWLLLGVAALAVVYVAVQRRRAAAMARYADAALLASVAPDRRDGKRHVPVVMSLAGLAAMVVALAQPTRAEAVTRDQGVVVLAVDVSASMEAVDVPPSRIAAAIDGATEFVDDVPEGIHVGLVAFDGGARVLVTPTTDHDSVLDAIAGLTTGEGTAAGEGVYASLDAITAALTPDVLESGEPLPATIVLLSDGTTTVGRSVLGAADAAADLGVPITTIAFGTPRGTVRVRGETVRVPADTETMAAVASMTDGEAYVATTAGELEDVYTDISTVVGTTTEQRELTRVAVGAALVLVAAATALAVAWGARAL